MGGMLGIDIGREIAADPTLAAPLLPGRPEVLAQVDWAVQREMAATVVDVLHRRTELHYRDDDQGLGALALVADRMAHLLGWDDAEKARQIKGYVDDVAASRAWRESADDSDGT